MPITRALAIRILRYLYEHKDFYFPFLVMCQEYTPEDDDFVEIEPEEWEMIAEDEEYQTFELWERVQSLDASTMKKSVLFSLKRMWECAYREVCARNKKFPHYACQHCGSERKFVETIIDDEFYWEDDENGYQAGGFTDNFEHTGNDRCAECGEKWTGGD